jgi:signal transduction histidine kinase
VSLCIGAVIACLLREQLRVRDTLLWIILAAAILNLLASIGSKRARSGSVARGLSTFLGLASWSVLAALTGGISSPFIAGLWLETVLSASASPRAILVTTVGAIAGVWSQSIHQGLEGHIAEFLLLTAFLIVTGDLTLRLARRWRRSTQVMSRQIALLRRRLARLEGGLNGDRRLADQEGDAAHLAHSLKNAVHSMRGFVQLLEPRVQSSAACEELLAGLRSAIDHLEALSRVTLGPAGTSSDAAPGDHLPAQRAVREAVDQVAVAFPGVRWSVSAEDTSAAAGPSAPVVRDALINVLRNAAEAMQGQGEVQVESAPIDGRLVVRIRDHGPGMPLEGMASIFQPGRTTKSDGHGLGLALTRRLLEAAGGRVTVSAADGGGLVCAVEIPLSGPGATLAGATGAG